MRWVMFSFTIIFFCLSMTIVNTVDDTYFLGDGTEINPAQNRSLFGWKSEPFITTDDLGHVKDADSLNSAVGDMQDVKSTPKDFIADIVDTGWTILAMGYNAMRFLLQTLFNSTLNVGPFLNTMGRDDIKLFPDIVATMITIGINMVYLIGIIQIIMKYNLKDGA